MDHLLMFHMDFLKLLGISSGFCVISQDIKAIQSMILF